MSLDEEYGEAYKEALGAPIVNILYKSKKGIDRWDLVYLVAQLTGIVGFAVGILTYVGDHVWSAMPIWLALGMTLAFMVAIIAMARSHTWRTKRESAMFAVWIALRPKDKTP